MKESKQKIESLGFTTEENTQQKCLEFIFKGSRIKYYPKKQWFTGKTVEDGRGLENLLSQLTGQQAEAKPETPAIRRTTVQEICSAGQKTIITEGEFEENPF